ncbi:hypothetical protein MMC25_008117 [Agyrium rufum]|nr:hypothetical protein [Agyrium rufum]
MSFEFSTEFPKSKIDYFDITSKQYPSEDLVPDNIKLNVHDAFKPFPESFLGKYDLVHVQTLLTIVKNNDPNGLIENFKALLSKLELDSPPPIAPRMNAN